VWGQHWDKVTANTLIGYAKGKDEIYPGLIDHAEEVIAVDQIESADRANLTRYLLDYMEDGACSFAAGGISYRQRGLAPLVFIANPLGSGGEKDFQRTLEVVSYNPALGGRIAIVFYFTDLAVIRGTSYALGHEEEERWRQAKGFVRAVEDYCRRELRRIYRHPKVAEWLKQPIPGYAERVAEIAKMLSLTNPQLHEFFLNHATQAAPKIRAAALQAALLFNLKDIALGTYGIDAILREAEEWLRRIVELNLASIANIVADYEGKRELNAKALFESLPNYAKAVIAVAEAYRRLVLKEYRGRGQVPEELRDVVLDNLKVSVEEYGYEYLSRALDIVKRRKRALEELNNAGFSLRLKFTLMEPQKQIKTTILDWSEQPISIPERLTRELAECSSFRQFRHFVSSSEGYQPPPPTREYPESIPSGPGNGVSPRGADEMTKLTKHASSEETNQAVRLGESNVPLKEDARFIGGENAETEKHMPAEFAETASDEKTKKEVLTQAEAIARLLEYIGEEGKPLRQVLEYAVKGLGLKRPEPLLHELLERGRLVKVVKGGETWLVRG